MEDTTDLFVDIVIQFCHQERIQHQVGVDRTDDDTVAVEEKDTSVERADMVADVLPLDVVEETRYEDDSPVLVAVEEIEFGLQ